ncbi:hypothetical protein [Endomicrobium proavitum]|uniref:Uncharacterized protein n=1 Tax=Endomicrobium proavitum TaxID=1408281 RepID=A0A0G3WKK9_9BACT|nr:hypothetical protein [Endomicrobium proavitum]AKL97989.1 conserved exported protein of unknown function [Endomicrobium proavitum]
MRSKKTTALLVIILIILILLLLLRSCVGFPTAKRYLKRVLHRQPAQVENVVQTVKKEVKPAVAPKPVAKKKAKPKKTKKKKVSKPSPKRAVSKPAVVKEEPLEAKSNPEENAQFKNSSGFRPFYVYHSIGNKYNHYYPSGKMGNMGALQINQAWKGNPKVGETCIQVVYNAYSDGVAWSGMYWQEPANNWGNGNGYGFNITGSERLSFWARGENGGETINAFIVGGIQGSNSEDSDSRSIGPIELTAEWEQYIIWLSDADLSNIIGGFGFTVTRQSNPAGCVFYLDNIMYE